MDFPAYVPAAVRKTISAYLNGDSDEVKEGLLAAIAAKKQLLPSIEASILKAEDSKKYDFIPYKLETIEEINIIAEKIDCLIRLAKDSRKRDAYSLLILEISSDDEWESFILAAAGACRDYGSIRERIRKANELIEAISEEVGKLNAILST